MGPSTSEARRQCYRRAVRLAAPPSSGYPQMGVMPYRKTPFDLQVMVVKGR